ncbi:MAG: PBSX family phage terminase large subunit [Clostridia bacterium]|nr:PBSX family phage terminase large subunit [Clostridia bacterium]MBQ7751723.1 PBSX family phage terminase large subunit [Clostridia bacterium]
MLRLTDKQKEFWKNATHRWNIKEGATRSGKTYLDYFLIPKRILNCKGEGLIVLLGNTKGTLSRNILEPMQSIWGDRLVGNIGSDNTVMLFGKKCHALGADRITQVSKLQGAGIEYCYGDEITTWNEDVFSMLKSRLDKPNSVFDGTCNPDSPNHWFLKFLESDADIFRQHYTIYDNPMLPENFIKNLECEYRGTVYFERFILGKWALAEGLIYPMFSEARHISSDIPDCREYYISIDYGTLNPCSMGLWCVNGKQAFRIREFYHDGRKSGRQMTDEEYYKELVKLADDLPVCYVIIDPSAASFIETVRRHGRFTVKKARNDVLDGIRFTAGLLSEDRIKIHPVCKSIIAEFTSYRWDSESDTDRPIKQNDHAMDDLRYFCYTILKRIW